MESRGRRARRNRYQFQQNSSETSSGAKRLLLTIGVVCLACSMLYNNKNKQANKDMMMLANSVEDIAQQLKAIQNSYQLLEDKFSICSQELPKLEKKLAAFETSAKILAANRFGWSPRMQPGLPYVDVKLVDLKVPAQKVTIWNITKAKNTTNLSSEYEKQL